MLQQKFDDDINYKEGDLKNAYAPKNDEYVICDPEMNRD